MLWPRTRSLPIILAALVCLLMLLSQPGSFRAGEPIRVGSATFGPDGAPTLWQSASFPIPYTTDNSPLGNDTEAATQARVVALFTEWQNVATSNISFTRTGFIVSNATAATCVTGGAGGDGNVDTVAEYDCIVGAGFPGNPIIYDDLGAIHDSLFGIGNSTLGFAGPLFSTAGGGTIIAARAVFNGKFRDGVPPDSTVSEFEATILHELGHYIGLGHSQINNNCLPSQGGCANFSDDTFGLPTMFPISIGGLEESPGVAPERTLAMDDIAWVSRLYPDATFAITHGSISGSAFFSDATTYLQGVNVIARQVDNGGTPENESRRNAVSGTSGYLYTGNRGLGSGFLFPTAAVPFNSGSGRGSQSVSLRGTYEIPVPAGVSYNVEVEAINPSFTGGSSVGVLGKEAGEQFGLPGTAPAAVPVGPVVAGSNSGGNNFTFTGTSATRDAIDSVATNDTPATATH
ncbi:MAG: hypothetical protein HY012_05725 [Acidobacteria bacterium]|nr:hypothetical protein [Acidobacteriota bacterium]